MRIPRQIALLAAGASAMIVAIEFPVTRFAALIVALMLFLIVGSSLSVAGKFSSQLSSLKGKSVMIQLWGDPPPKTSSDMIFRVHSIRAIGVGLHMWFQSVGRSDQIHLKIAQPKALTRTGHDVQITEAKYLQWESQKVMHRAGVPAVVFIIQTQLNQLS
jgi:hypothetical protein